jgi:hypothetical protein
MSEPTKRCNNGPDERDFCCQLGCHCWHYGKDPDECLRPPIPCAGEERNPEVPCHAEGAEERMSFGIYAGKGCDAHWPLSGYRDATNPQSEADWHRDIGSDYAGEEY